MKPGWIRSRRESIGLLTVARLAVAMLALWAACPATCVTAQTPGATKGKPETYYDFVFNNPVAGREDEYNKWYDHQHALDVVAVPGIMTAQRFVLSDQQLRDSKPPAKYLVIYKIVTDDLPSVQAEVSRRLQTGMTVLSPSLDQSSSVSSIYKASRPVIDPRNDSDHKSHANDLSKAGGQAYYHLVFSNPVAGKEDEYNSWYDQQYIPDVVAVPGFVSGQRLAFATAGLHAGATKYQDLVVFKIVTDDLPSVYEAFKHRSPRMVMSPAFGESASYTYKAIGPLIDGDKVRADRAKGK